MKLPEGAPYELLNGKLKQMASPFTLHQRISILLSTYLFLFVRKNTLGEVLSAPMDVHFDKKNIVQPDVLFISNERKKIIDKWVMGAPDLIIEIHSKSTKTKDKKPKFKLYEKYAVKEYWMVDTDKRTVDVQILVDGKFHQKSEYKKGEILQSDILKGFEISIDEIFEKDN